MANWGIPGDIERQMKKMQEAQQAEEKKAYESQISGLQATGAAQASALQQIQSAGQGQQGGTVSSRLMSSFVDPNTGSMGDAKSQDLVKGAQFGEAVLGEGFGRMSENEGMQNVLAQQQELSKGMGSAEMVARREQAGQQIDKSTQGSSRALQAALARAGVKGGAAGAKLRDVQLGGLAQKAGAERDLLIQDREAREASLGRLAGTTSDVAKFDIKQAAKEKGVALQAGLGFAGLGATERGAAAAAAATRHSANVQAASNSK